MKVVWRAISRDSSCFGLAFSVLVFFGRVPDPTDVESDSSFISPFSSSASRSSSLDNFDGEISSMSPAVEAA